MLYGLAGCLLRVATALLGSTVDTCSHVRSTVVFFEPVYLTVTCSVLVLPELCRIMVSWEMTSGICFCILYQCLVRQRIQALRQSTELLNKLTFFLCGVLGR